MRVVLKNYEREPQEGGGLRLMGGSGCVLRSQKAELTGLRI